MIKGKLFIIWMTESVSSCCEIAELMSKYTLKNVFWQEFFLGGQT